MTAVVVYALDDAVTAAGAAAGRPLTLVSAPAAGAAAGAGWFAALAAAVRRRCPDAALTFVLDCGDSPGAVMAALRAGIAEIAVAPPALTPALRALAERHGARLHTAPVPALDLRLSPDPMAALARHLAGEDS